MIASARPVATEDPAWGVRHEELVLLTRRPLEFVDLTAEVGDFVRRTGLWNGIVSVQTRHTTTAVVLNEHEPLLFEDLEARLQAWAPESVAYRHDDPCRRTVNRTAGERRNGHAHARAVILGAHATVHVVEGRLRLGRWQRILLVELDGGQRRTVSIMALGQQST